MSMTLPTGAINRKWHLNFIFVILCLISCCAYNMTNRFVYITIIFTLFCLNFNVGIFWIYQLIVSHPFKYSICFLLHMNLVPLLPLDGSVWIITYWVFSSFSLLYFFRLVVQIRSDGRLLEHDCLLQVDYYWDFKHLVVHEEVSYVLGF